MSHDEKKTPVTERRDQVLRLLEQLSPAEIDQAIEAEGVRLQEAAERASAERDHQNKKLVRA